MNNDYLAMVQSQALADGEDVGKALARARKSIKSGDIPLSWGDLDRQLKEINDGNPNIAKDIPTFSSPSTSIEDIFRGRGHCIMYHAWPGRNMGHWVVAVRRPQYVFYFDSYGKDPYFPLKKIIKNGLLIINDEKLQANNTANCGRYCLAVVALNKLGYLPEEIIKILKFFGEKGLIKIENS